MGIRTFSIREASQFMRVSEEQIQQWLDSKQLASLQADMVTFFYLALQEQRRAQGLKYTNWLMDNSLADHIRKNGFTCELDGMKHTDESRYHTPDLPLCWCGIYDLPDGSRIASQGTRCILVHGPTLE